MGNSPVDKGKEFKDSGMTLITEKGSDYWLNKYKEWKQRKELVKKALDSLDK